jgi:hypothetical protein
MFWSNKANDAPSYYQCCYTKPESKHWLEYLVFLFVLISAIATSCAAYYTAKQYEISVDSEQRQLRAYISASPEIGIFSPRLDINPFVRIHAFGQSPAIDVVGTMGVGYRESKSIGSWNELNKTAHALRASVTKPILSPKADEFMEIRLNEGDKWAPDEYHYKTAIAGDGRLAIWGEVHFSDIFGCKRWIKYCFLFHGESIAGENRQPEECADKNQIDESDKCQK